MAGHPRKRGALGKAHRAAQQCQVARDLRGIRVFWDELPCAICPNCRLVAPGITDIPARHASALLAHHERIHSR